MHDAVKQRVEVDALPYPSRPTAWTAVAVLTALYIVSMLDRNIITLLGTAIQRDMQLTDVQLSLLYGPAFGLFYSCASLPLGWAIDQFQRRHVIFSMVMLWSLSMVGSGFANSFAMLFAGRAGVGSGEAVLHPASQSIFSDMFPPQRLSFAMAIYSLGAKTGQSLSFLVGGMLAAVILPAGIYAFGDFTVKGWQLIFLIVAVPGILLAALIYIIPEPTRRAIAVLDSRPMTYMRYLGVMVREWRFYIMHHLGQTLFLAAFWSVSAWAPAFLERSHGFTPSQVGQSLGVALLVGALVGIPLHGLIVDKLFQRGIVDAPLRYLIVVAVLSVVPGVAAMLVDSALVSIIAIGFFVATVSAYASLPSAALQIVVPPGARGRAAAIMALVNSIFGMSMGPVAVGLIVQYLLGDPQQVGIAIAICVAVFLLLAALSFWVALRPYRSAVAQRGLTAS